VLYIYVMCMRVMCMTLLFDNLPVSQVQGGEDALDPLSF